MIRDQPLYRELLEKLERHLEVISDKPDETPESTLTCLWSLAAGRPVAVSQLAMAALDDIDATAQSLLEQLIERRLNGVPLAHITGRQDFMGIVLKASEAALVPRKETELLGWGALEAIDEQGSDVPLVVDLCTGSGNLALAIAIRAPRARVTGSDLSEEAIKLAGENAQYVGRPDVVFHVGDLAQPFDNEEFLGRIDVLTCNPPYISSVKVGQMHQEISCHEPRLAFDGGPFGINIIQRLIKEAPRLLKSGGWLLFEVGLGQGDTIHKRLERNANFDMVRSVRDANGDIRVLSARRS